MQLLFIVLIPESELLQMLRKVEDSTTLKISATILRHQWPWTLCIEWNFRKPTSTWTVSTQQKHICKILKSGPWDTYKGCAVNYLAWPSNKISLQFVTSVTPCMYGWKYVSSLVRQRVNHVSMCFSSTYHACTTWLNAELTFMQPWARTICSVGGLVYETASVYG